MSTIDYKQVFHGPRLSGGNMTGPVVAHLNRRVVLSEDGTESHGSTPVSIELEVTPVGPGDQNPDFRAASPFGKMPALVDGDYCLPDSSAIVHYLEAMHPEPALIPVEPRARARTIWFDEFADTVLGAAGMLAFEPSRQVEGGFTSYGDALWWTAYAMTTGVPTTPASGEGRLLGWLLSLYGLAIFGYLTATIASFFVGRDAQESKGPIAGNSDIRPRRPA